MGGEGEIKEPEPVLERKLSSYQIRFGPIGVLGERVDWYAE